MTQSLGAIEGKALGVVFLWGLLFVLVLTMISGARELMTPGAWEKKGLTYRLTDDPSAAVERQITARRLDVTRDAEAGEQAVADFRLAQYELSRQIPGGGTLVPARHRHAPVKAQVSWSLPGHEHV